uniref:Putative transcription elongation factor spt5 n=1 Tax=Amblyomma aureolatum TaxID=187763 RepID=A0A1E1X5N3_9ACAR
MAEEELKKAVKEEPEDGPPGGKAKKSRFKDCDEGREFECVLCDCKFFTVGQYSVHIQSFEHRKRSIQKVANKAYDRAPQYKGGRDGDLPPGLSGRKVVHCKVCNVFTNSAKQLAEHLGGARHKQLCFKFNVPVTTLALTKEDTHTLESTRLQGERLMCKHCSVEINSMQQYTEHMNSAKHKLRAENKPLRPDRNIKKALKTFYKSQKKRDKQDKKEEEAEASDGGKSQEGDERPKDEEREEKNDKEREKKDSNISKVRDKYQLKLLDELSELPTLRNEMHFYRNQRPTKEKKPPRVKPVPFMCDVCQVFTKSAFELNEHLMGEEHRVALKKFLVDGKSAMASSADDQLPRVKQEVEESPTEGAGGGKEEEPPKKPELYCDACQLLLPSLGAKREHEKGKKHKFLQELRKGVKMESHTQGDLATAAARGGGDRKEARPRETAPKSVHCSLCMVDVESEAAMKEHIKSKKHKFLSELKPEPEAVRRPEAALKRKRPWPRDSSDRDRREPAQEEVMPELAAVALERQALQVELAKRRREIEEQRRLIDKLREEQHLEEEKAALRRMIDECRQLIEERERRKRRAAEEQDRAHKSRSVRWRRSPEPDRCQGSSHEYRSFATRCNEEIPLLGTSSVGDRMSSEESLWEADRKPGAPVSQEPSGRLGGTGTAFSPFEPSTNSWPDWSSTSQAPDWSSASQAPDWSSASQASDWSTASQAPDWSTASQAPDWSTASQAPDWFSASQAPDWQRPVLCTPPTRVGLLGDRPQEWGHSVPSPPATETQTWGSSTTRIPGLDFV